MFYICTILLQEKISSQKYETRNRVSLRKFLFLKITLGTKNIVRFFFLFSPSKFSRLINEWDPSRLYTPFCCIKCIFDFFLWLFFEQIFRTQLNIYTLIPTKTDYFRTTVNNSVLQLWSIWLFCIRANRDWIITYSQYVFSRFQTFLTLRLHFCIILFLKRLDAR